MRQPFFSILAVLLHLLPFTLTGQFTAITNQGQWPDHVAASAQLNGGNIFFADNAVHYNFIDTNYVAARHAHHRSASGEGFASDRDDMDRLRGHHYQMHFKDASENARITFQDQYEGRANYFLGNDPEKWGRNAKRYGKVTYENIYEGVDCSFFQNEDGHLKYEFTLEPGADPSDIRLRYDHVKSLRLTDNGQLKIGTSVNEATEFLPLVYQPNGDQIDTVACHFQLNNNTVTFRFPDGYDTSRALVIDPVLTFSTYSGSEANNFGFTATYDKGGHLYGGGIAFGQGYPTTVAAYDTTFGGGEADIAISKFTKDGSQLIYSTYIGGNSSETPNSLFVRDNGELYIYGFTGSANFPVTPQGYDTTFNGGQALAIPGSGTEFGSGTDIYVAKLSPAGDSLLASTFIGGSNNDGPNTALREAPQYPDTSLNLNYGDAFRGEIIVDDSGNAYVATCTRSDDFPLTADAFIKNFNGSQDGAIFQLSSNLEELKWSSYLGGKDIDAAFSIKLDEQNRLVVAGGTTSEDFPSDPEGQYPNYRGGAADGFVIIFDNNTKERLYGTFIGGSDYDVNYFIEVDYEGNIYVTGNTSSGNYPVKGDNAVYSESGQYITKFDDTLGTILMSTRFGSGSGEPEMSPTAFLVDDCKNIYVSGWGGGTNEHSLSEHPDLFMSGMPLTADAFQSTTDGSDFYFIVFSEDADSLIYATYFGGELSTEHVDGGTSRFDKEGIIYQAVCAGCFGNSDFPTTPDAFSAVNRNRCNLGVLKFEFQLLEVKADAIAGPDTFGCAPLEVQFENRGTKNAYYYWDFDNGDFAEKENPIYTYMEAGSYTPTLIVKPRKPCLIGDTTQLHVEVLELTEAAFDYSPPQIELKERVNFENQSKGGTEYRWFLDGEPVSNKFNWQKQFEEAGYYNVCLEIENEQCVDSICKELVVPIIGVPNAFSPNGDGHNDVLYVKGVGVTELDFRVYNRWGALMFQTNDLEKGWDGTYKGKPQEMDTYVYVLNATLENGNVIDEKGNITLIR